LTTQLAAHEGVAPSQIVIGAGSGELLKMAGLLAVTTAGAEVVASRPTYEELPVFAQTLGLKVQWVAADDDHRHDLSAMRAAITPLTRLVYVCNPNNPTGTAVTRDALETFIRSVPVSCTVIVDEAYMDLVDQPGVATVAALVNAVPNMLVLRTFSKPINARSPGAGSSQCAGQLRVPRYRRTFEAVPGSDARRGYQGRSPFRRL
jgi:histidinol-phosphate aminotransferase